MYNNLNNLDYLKNILYIFCHKSIINIYIKLGLIIILYYIVRAIKLSNGKILLIDDLYIYIINFITISLLLIRIFISHINYKSNSKLINQIYNNGINLYTNYICYYQLNELHDELHDELNITYPNQIVISNNYTNENYTNENYTNENYPNENYTNRNYTNENYTNRNYTNGNYTNENYTNYNNLKEIILLYITYVFNICKIKNNNTINKNNIRLKDYNKFDHFINEEIHKLYYNFNIKNFNLKINYINTNLTTFLINSYNEDYLTCYNYNILINIKSDLSNDIKSLINNLDNIIFKLLNYINNILINISIISLIIYYINYLPQTGIILIIIISFIYLYFNNLIYLLSNNFKYINSINKKNYGIDLDNILHNFYDEIHIFTNINIKKILYRY